MFPILILGVLRVVLVSEIRRLTLKQNQTFFSYDPLYSRGNIISTKTNFYVFMRKKENLMGSDLFLIPYGALILMTCPCELVWRDYRISRLFSSSAITKELFSLSTRAPRDDKKRCPVPSHPASFLFENPVSRAFVSRPIPHHFSLKIPSLELLCPVPSRIISLWKSRLSSFCVPSHPASRALTSRPASPVPPHAFV